nr:feline leukemia virus subgroup C receptor-related protein 1 isoform X2 [Parasteatoda tepidariorum]
MENEQFFILRVRFYLNTSPSTSTMRKHYGTDSTKECNLSSNFYKNLSSDTIVNNMTIHKVYPDHSEKTALYPDKQFEKSAGFASIKLYKRRFLMLFVFMLCSMMNGVPQYQYTVVADIISCYYGVSLNDVNWASVVYMVAFLPLVFPVMYLMDTKGLRITLVLGGVLNFLGSVVQCYTLSPDRYVYVMVCQTIYAMGQVFVLSLPPFIAGVWFGANEVGLACAMGVFGNQLGIAIGFIFTPLALTNDCNNTSSITEGLGCMAYPQVIVNIIILFIIVFVFEEKPKLYPSIAQATKHREGPEYGASLKRLFRNGPFVLLLIAYGLITGAYFAMSTILNEMVLIHFPGDEVDAGRMGAIMVFAGMIGSVLLGIFLDRTHKYKEISVLVFTVSFLLMLGYTFLIKLEHIWIQYVFLSFLGLFMTGYLPAGFDFGAEITYPEPEAMSGSLLNASTQIFSILFTHAASSLLQNYNDFYSNILFSSSLLLGLIIIVCMKCNLRRTNAAFDELKPRSKSLE